MNNFNKKDYVANELDVLDKAIEYAKEHSTARNNQYQNVEIIENLIKIQKGQQSAYGEFLRVAWGKAIRIKSTYKGELTFRLSQSAAVIPKASMSTPQSPIGRLVNVARAGDTYESEMLGKYTIEDVWYFERYSGFKFVQEIKNFKLMMSTGKNEFTINNLLNWIMVFDQKEDNFEIKDESERMNNYIDKRLSEELCVEEDSVDWQRLTSIDETIEEDLFDEEEYLDDERESISLSTKFYVNLTEGQYDSAHWGATGLVFVFGVAGSGKTSVALGRSKSLAQLGQLPYNDKLYNNDFSEETQIGIVRTGELISYLKETCSMLSLYRLPVVEYRTIVEELKTYWDIVLTNRGEKNKPKYLLAPSKDQLTDDSDTRRKWFDLISHKMLSIYIEQVLTSVENNIASKNFNAAGKFITKINNKIYQDIKSVLKRLEAKNKVEGFIEVLDKRIEESVYKLFNQSIWIGIPTNEDNVIWLIDTIDDLAVEIKTLKNPLCFHNGINDVKFIIPKSDVKHWRDWIPIETVEVGSPEIPIPKSILLKTNADKLIKIDIAIASDETLVSYARKNQLRLYNGVGKITQRIRTKNFYFADTIELVNNRDDGGTKETSVWRSKIKSAVINKLKRIFKNHCNLIPANLFVEAISNWNKDNHSIHNNIISLKLEQINKKQLDEADIDLLLAFMAAVLRTTQKQFYLFKDKYVQAPLYRSSVFIDEVQDFSEIQIYLLSLVSNPKYNSVTAVGDSAQCLFRSTSDISNSFPVEMWADAKKQELTENIRQQDIPTLNAFGTAFRKQFIDEISAKVIDYVKNDSVYIYQRKKEIEQLRLAYKIIGNISRSETIVIVVPSIERATKTIATLKPHLREHQHRDCNYSSTIDLSKRYIAHVTTPKNIKGLEFDHLIALYMDEYDLSIDNHRNGIYVMITRPKKTLSLIGNINKMDLNFVDLLSSFADIKKE